MKKEDILVIDAEAEDYKEAIECAGNCLFKEGYVKDNFVEECLKREQIYPTGLPSATPIAIPHCASKFVEKEGMCVVRLKRNVDFHRIDDAEQCVSTSLIFNLALKKDEQHVTFLQKFILALGNEEGNFAKECMTLKKEEVSELFVKYQIL
ncbi:MULTISPECIES: PTS sugar transporter subunit IIA [Mediterraneibacter]|uniref:PTS sugar transporter subunit IIA n=1 Tax=Mediterraneibacter TaxID=2316020 RepID=UPI000E494BE2|nr:PTS sugar transporter subunit IIA [Mediterraneibacter massiliensis]RGT73809.1 PTS sugar transporter subunit IIA [Ruminococcus sp. AF18-22]